MNTLFLLLAQYGGKPVIPVEDICRDFFTHLTPEKFIRKVSTGDLPIPLIRMEASQKCAKGVHIEDLAKYIDGRSRAAKKEYEAMYSRS